MKKLLCLIMAVAMICAFPVQALAVTNESASREVDEFFLQHGATQDSINAISAEDKAILFEVSEETPAVSAETLNAFFAATGVSNDILSLMDYTVQLTIYESLQPISDEPIEFIDYTVEYASGVDNPLSPQVVNAQGLSDWLEFSTSVFYVGGNLNRYYIYPSFEWIAGGTVLTTDTFSFALHSSYWKVYSEDNLKVYYLDGALRYETAASQVGFSARSYNMGSCISNDLNIPYKGTGCLVARPMDTTVDDRIIFNYAQNLNRLIPVSVNLGIFSISVSGFERQYGLEARFHV